MLNSLKDRQDTEEQPKRRLDLICFLVSIMSAFIGIMLFAFTFSTETVTVSGAALSIDEDGFDSLGDCEKCCILLNEQYDGGLDLPCSVETAEPNWPYCRGDPPDDDLFHFRFCIYRGCRGDIPCEDYDNPHKRKNDLRGCKAARSFLANETVLFNPPADPSSVIEFNCAAELSITPTTGPTLSPSTPNPTSSSPTQSPTLSPSTLTPTGSPTFSPSTLNPTTSSPTLGPSYSPSTTNPSTSPSEEPSVSPAALPTQAPSFSPIQIVVPSTSNVPISAPSQRPTSSPIIVESLNPTFGPPSSAPVETSPSAQTTITPSVSPTEELEVAASSEPANYNLIWLYLGLALGGFAIIVTLAYKFRNQVGSSLPPNVAEESTGTNTNGTTSSPGV